MIFAREAHEAVIFRRGPSAWFHVIRWNTKTDQFYPGAWLKGRIYPEKCDLSPDGELLLSFIHQGRNLRTGYTDAWSAISRTPWLHALGLWPQGTTYGGGGRFTDNRSAVLRFYPVAAHPDHLGAGLDISFIASDTSFARENDLAPLHCSTSEIAGVEWTGRDQRGRLIYTAHGKLICAATKTRDEICLADFNNLVPDPQPPPFSATVPLSANQHPRRAGSRQR
ncbi:protein of unknown function [Bradyrhizobium sp. ORS 285]|uniref:hypothetical protein n=1 Tax=Bradyrhizobium sp. ORS 285 TaxID=115808 RepID=UPI000240B173|nr:hypothetical protein [Bradyrhizobium sp. ORS 285]CCD85333.1 hypothetical protein BRAO285_1380092 [Bradyrhizobium sp. ORS 285]SMX57416.1 protein of unknown function [Bradyrhizobium sp. ORS 285]